MRKVRGVKRVCEYLEEIHCPMSTSTITRLMKKGAVPFSKPAPKVVIFDLDDIDKWIGGDYQPDKAN